MNNESISPPTLETVDERPRQFKLAHLMAGVSAAALICAILAPLLRMMAPGNRLTVVGMFFLQGLALAGTYFIFTTLRKRAIRKAGRRIGVGRHEAFGDRPWLLFVPMALVGIMSFIQLGMAIVMAIRSNAEISWIYFTQQAQIGFFAGMFLAYHRRGGSLAGIEFFENGVLIGHVRFTPWERVQLRPCHVWDNRLTMITGKVQNVFSNTTTTVLVDPPLREYLLVKYGPGDDTP